MSNIVNKISVTNRIKLEYNKYTKQASLYKLEKAVLTPPNKKRRMKKLGN